MKKTSGKKIISVLLSLMLILSSLPFTPITAFAGYWDEVVEEYEYYVKVKTTNDADGWNDAFVQLYTFDDKEFRSSSAEIKRTITSSIDDDGDEFTETFKSKRFLDKVRLYVDFGGGFTWRDWEGDITVKINGEQVINQHVEASASPFSSSDEDFGGGFYVPANKRPEPGSNVNFYVKSADSDELSSDLELTQTEDEEEGKISGLLYVEFADQYNVSWKYPEDITITSDTHPDNDIAAFDSVSGAYSVYKLTSDFKTDHTSQMTFSCTTNNIKTPVVEKKFNVDFKFLHKLTVSINEKEYATHRGYTDDVYNISDLEIPEGHWIKSYKKTGPAGTLTKNSDGTATFVFGNGDAAVNAQTAAITYYVTYDRNAEDATGKMSKTSLTYGVLKQLDRNKFKRTGYEFVGWNTEPDGSGTSYSNAQFVKNLTTQKGSTVTLYAQWAAIVHNVTLVYPEEMGIEDTVIPMIEGATVPVDEFVSTDSDSGHYRFVSADKELTNVKSDMTVNLTYEKIAHDYNETVTVNPECYTDGEKTLTCKYCGYEKTEVIPAFHQDVCVYEGYPATCTADGHETVVECKACDEILEDGQVIPALGHDYDYDNVEWKFSTASGTLEASAIVKCKNDSSHKLFDRADITKQENGFLVEATIVDDDAQDHNVSTFLEIGKDIYAVNITTDSNGTMTASPEYAFEGDRVILNSTPNSGYYLSDTTVTKGGEEIALSGKTFTMPAGAVEVNAAFSNIAPNQCGENAFWKYDKDTETLTIAGTGEMFNYGASSVYGETPFRKPQFNNCKHIVIEDGITKVGDNAFYGMKFSTAVSTADVIMANSVTEIGNSAFRDMSTRVEINLPANLETIGDYAFRNAQASNNYNQINMIPASVTHIGDMAFNNVSLTDLYCYADPSVLYWRGGNYDFIQTNTSSMKTKIHVYADSLSGYQSTSKIRVNANFVGDLDSKVHNISLVQNEHCTISSNYDKMNLNGKIMLYAQPDEGYAVEKFIVTDSYNEERTVTKNKFTMPNSDVTVSVAVVPTYNIITDTSGGHGYFDVKSSAKEGETVTATYIAYDEYVPSSFIVTDESSNTVEVNCDTFVMPASDVTVSAVYEEPKFVKGTKPYIDDDGAYVTGIADHYAASNGVNYAVNADAGVGSKLDSLELSYFDFSLLADGTYRVNYYTGPTKDLTEIVIPKTYNGKKITVVGSDYNDRFYDTEKTQINLVLNENITEISKYTFYTLYVKRVTGDLSGLRKVGNYAFSWVNSPGGYAIELDLEGNSDVAFGTGAFNNMNVTFNIKHATTVNYSNTNYKTVKLNYTDAHTCGEPVWSWAEDNSSAAATFTCSVCNQQFEVDATVTTKVISEPTCTDEGSAKYTATVEFNSETYTDVKEVALPCEPMNTYSLTLDDGINVNFYIDTPYYEAEGGTIQYSYLTTTEDKSAERTVYSADVADLEQQDDGTRKLSLSAAPAQIAEDYLITVYDADGNEKAAINASIEDYCLAITASDDARMTPYKDIAQSLLDYGALADEYFGYAALSKELTGNDYAVSHSDDYKAAVDTSDSSHLRTNAHASMTQGSVKIKSVSYVALLEPEFRFYITKADDTEFTEAEAAALTVGIDVDGLTARTVKTDSGICVRVTDLKSDEFAKAFTLTVGDTTLTYNGYAYLYTVLTNAGITDTKLKDLAKGVYRYAAAAEATFA